MIIQYNNPAQFFTDFCKLAKFSCNNEQKKHIKYFLNLLTHNDEDINYWFFLEKSNGLVNLKIFQEQDYEIKLISYDVTDLVLQGDKISFELNNEFVAKITEYFNLFFKIELNKNWDEEYLKTLVYEEDETIHSRLQAFVESLKYFLSLDTSDTLKYCFLLWTKFPSEKKFPKLFYFRINDKFIGKSKIEDQVADCFTASRRHISRQDFLLHIKPWDWARVTDLSSAVKQYMEYEEYSTTRSVSRSLWLWEQTASEYKLSERVKITDKEFILELDTLLQNGERESVVWTQSLSINPLELFKRICNSIIDQAVFLDTQIRAQAKFSKTTIKVLGDIELISHQAISKIDFMTQEESIKVIQQVLKDPLTGLHHDQIGQIGFVNSETDDLYVYLIKVKKYLMEQVIKARDEKLVKLQNLDFWKDW